MPVPPAEDATLGTVHRAMEMIAARACDGLTPKEIARTLRISRLTLQREVQAHFSKTPAQILKLARLRRAKELLTSTQLPIKQIAPKVGFHRASNFCAFFRKHEGLSPTEFRASQATGDLTVQEPQSRPEPQITGSFSQYFLAAQKKRPDGSEIGMISDRYGQLPLALMFDHNALMIQNCN